MNFGENRGKWSIHGAEPHKHQGNPIVRTELVLFGSMCSGKTTVAQILKNEAGFEVIAAKELIERHAREDVSAARARGALLPDEQVIQWFGAALDAARGPVLVDGFPRSEAQARWLLRQRPHLRRAVFLDFPPDVIRRRFESRMLCAACPMPTSSRFADFDQTCVYCGSREFRRRPTDRPDYFDVKMAQFRSVSMQVLPVLREAGLAFDAIADHARLADLRAEVLRLHGN